MKYSSPLLLRQVINYIPYRNTISYINQKSDSCGDIGNDFFRKIIPFMQFGELYKFDEVRKLWNGLTIPIPLLYLEEIRADIHVLEFTVDEDVSEFYRALENPVYPDNFIILAEKPFNYDLPPQIYDSEKESFLSAFSVESGYECRMHYDQIKTIFAFPDGRTLVSLHVPHAKIISGMINFEFYQNDFKF